jgi:hypothetical protein
VVYHIFLSVLVGIDLNDRWSCHPQRTVCAALEVSVNANLLNLRRPAAGGYIQLPRNQGILQFGKLAEERPWEINVDAHVLTVPL